VDDFDGWTESPPQLKDETVVAELSGWQREVSVQRVSAANPSQLVAGESGAKRITVTIKHNRLIVATRVAIRTKAP
jgi:MSHA pilin protein MshD